MFKEMPTEEYKTQELQKSLRKLRRRVIENERKDKIKNKRLNIHDTRLDALEA